MGTSVYGRCGQIGLVVPANNSVIEPERWSALPPDVAVYATRIMAKGDLTPEAVRRMEADVDNAFDAIAATGVDVIAYCDMVTMPFWMTWNGASPPTSPVNAPQRDWFPFHEPTRLATFRVAAVESGRPDSSALCPLTEVLQPRPSGIAVRGCT